MNLVIPDNATNKDIIELLYGKPEKENDTCVLYKLKWGKTKRKYFYTHLSKEWLNLPLKLKGEEQ